MQKKPIFPLEDFSFIPPMGWTSLVIYTLMNEWFVYSITLKHRQLLVQDNQNIYAVPYTVHNNYSRPML